MKLGPYEILDALGAGGMGEVYKARDPKLDRWVAIKVLPEHLAKDPVALARFEREAKALATLQHPNVLGIFDFGSEEGTVFAVMELLEGETLRELIGRGPLPRRRLVDIAGQMAHGLSAAHAKGIVHRDLKPENVFLMKDGHVKLLDFGLAKNLSLPRPQDLSTMAPGAAAATEKGMLLGTLSYMSPEQIRGGDTDLRSDLFSFGVMLFEMMTGRRAYSAPSAVEILAAILTTDPLADEALRASLDPGLERILARCLEKEPAQRFQSAQDLAFALDGLTPGSTGVVTRPYQGIPDPLRRRRWVRALGITGLVCAGLAVGYLAFRGSSWELPILRPLSPSGRDAFPSASPDGKTVAFVSERGGGSRIWLLQVASGSEIALTEGPGDDFPQVSPDGSEVLFRRREGAEYGLFRVPAVGGQPIRIAKGIEQGAWSPDGHDVVLLRQAVRGAPRTAVSIAHRDGSEEHRIAELLERFLTPRWSPDGAWIALVTMPQSAGAPQTIYLLSPQGKLWILPAHRAVGRVSVPTWLGSRTLLYAQALSAGGALPGMSAQLISHPLSWGHSTPLLWLPDRAQVVDRIGEGIIFDSLPQRQGLREISPEDGAAASWITHGSSSDRQPTVSPDGEWVAFSSNRSGNLDLWAVSLKTRALRRLTDHPADDWDPSFSPDGRKLLWSSNRGGNFEIWMAEADGSGARKVSSDGVDAENPTLTTEGPWIYHLSGNPAHRGLWRLHPDGSGAQLLVRGVISAPMPSPDGRFAAYNLDGVDPARIIVVSVQDGAEVFTGPLPGHRVMWSPDGRTLAYISSDGSGNWGAVVVQPFVPGKDTSAQRHFAYRDPESPAETFTFTPDGRRIIVSAADPSKGLMLATGIRGLGK